MCHLFRLVASHLTGLHTSWIIPSHPADFFYLFFFILTALFFSTGGTALVVLSATPGRFLIFRGSAFVVLRVFPADLRLSAVLPPLVCVLPLLVYSNSRLLLSENQEAACPTYTQSRIGSGRAGEETAGVGRAQGREGGGGRESTGGLRL